MDGNSSELEENEDDGGRGGGVGASQFVPQTPDQEAFLKEHFVTLADLSSSGTSPSVTHQQQRNKVRTTNKFNGLQSTSVT